MSQGGILEIKGEKFVLKFGKEYLIGRKSNEASHDIEIDDPSVDIKHSILDLTQNSTPQLFDVCSEHGTFVDGLQVVKLSFTRLPKNTKIRFGNVEASLQLLTESDSGFQEERVNSSTNDISGIICNTPNQISSSESRLKNSLKNSLTSTPNSTSGSNANNSGPNASNQFLLPTKLAPRTSLNSNTSARSSDSFFIPETQYPQDAINNRTHNSTDISVYSNKSKRHSTIGDADDDFFIPETQEVITKSAIPLSNRARVAFPNDDVNETLSQDDRMPSSQFRICTQDFNGSDDDNSNHSGDLLANIPMSLVIPPIHHKPEIIDDFVKVDEEEDDDDNNFVKDIEKEVDKEMSALQWSKQTMDEAAADGSVTPDDLFDVVGSVTSDLVRVKSPDKASSRCSTSDLFCNPGGKSIDEILQEIEKEEIVEPDNHSEVDGNKEENTSHKAAESPLSPTLAFCKPTSKNSSFQGPRVPQPTAMDDQEDFEPLPETQAFSPPKILSKPFVLNIKKSLPETQAFTPSRPAIVLNDSLLPTQVFSPPKIQEKEVTAAKIANNHVFALPLASPKQRLSVKPHASPKPEIVPPIGDDEDDLPPTQVFEKEEHNPSVPTVAQKICLSSTLVDSGMQLSENSFKAKFNKLLDSDDDEMDEVIAPELVKQMRQSLENPEKPEIPNRSTPEQPVAETPKKPQQIEPEKPSPIPASTPNNRNFLVPAQARKSNNIKAPAVSIDNYLLTPDFLGREICKDTQLQKEAEVNWRNLVLQKRNKALFGDENSPDEHFKDIDSDDSQDSFVDLLPKRRVARTKSESKAPKNEASKPKEIKEEVFVRITRRKSTYIDVKQPKQEELKKRGRKKKETQTKEEDGKPSLDCKQTFDEKEIKEDPKLAAPRTAKITRKASIVEKTNENSHSLKEEPSVSMKEEKPISQKKESKPSAMKMSSSDDNPSDTTKDRKPASQHKEKVTRTRRKVEGKAPQLPPCKVEIEKIEKPAQSRATKRNAESTKTSSKSSKVNKLDEVAIVCKKLEADETVKPPPRITRLRSTETKPEDKKATSSYSRKKKELVAKTEPPKNVPDKIKSAEEVVDLTNSYVENQSIRQKPLRKRKSQEDMPYTVSISRLSGSQSSVGSSDSDRTLRRKKKLKVAMTSCSQATRDVITRCTGRMWDYTEDPKECDVLILEAGNRTYKLLVAIARGVPIVRVDWLKEVIATKSTNVEFDRFIFNEPNFQTRHKFVMKDVLQLARTTSLFKDLNFMMTPNISPNPEEMNDIITCAGGSVLPSVPTARDKKSFYLVSEKVDCQLWHRYRRAGQNVTVIAAVCVMNSVMQQSLEPLKKTLN